MRRIHLVYGVGLQLKDSGFVVEGKGLRVEGSGKRAEDGFYVSPEFTIQSESEEITRKAQRFSFKLDLRL